MEDFLQKKNLFTISFSIITVLPIFDIQEKSRNGPVIGGLLNVFSGSMALLSTRLKGSG
jgi:hypothetical protein